MILFSFLGEQLLRKRLKHEGELHSEELETLDLLQMIKGFEFLRNRFTLTFKTFA